VVPIAAAFPFTVDGVLDAAEGTADISGSGTGADRRLVVEDAEPVTVEVDGERADAAVVAYREVIEIPPGW
jgi:hypothetical protein